MPSENSQKYTDKLKALIEEASTEGVIIEANIEGGRRGLLPVIAILDTKAPAEEAPASTEATETETAAKE